MEQNIKKNHTSLIGQLLVATPQLQDQRFHQAVLFICGHDEKGAMGLIINKLIESLTLGNLFKQMDISSVKSIQRLPVHFGGPVEMGRGFILHSTDFLDPASVKVSPDFALSATLDVLRVMGQGKGPKNLICTLGYTGWAAGQLESELKTNSWIQMDADPQLVFHTAPHHHWQAAMDKIGINPDLFSIDIGHA